MTDHITNQWTDAETVFTSIELKDNMFHKIYTVLERGTLVINEEYGIFYEIAYSYSKDEYALSFSFSTRDGICCIVSGMLDIFSEEDSLRVALERSRIDYLEEIQNMMSATIKVALMQPLAGINVSEAAIKKLSRSWPVYQTLFPDQYEKEVLPLIRETLLNQY